MCNEFKFKCDLLWGNPFWLWFDYEDTDLMIIACEEQYNLFCYLYEIECFELAFEFSKFADRWNENYLPVNDEIIHCNF